MNLTFLLFTRFLEDTLDKVTSSRERDERLQEVDLMLAASDGEGPAQTSVSELDLLRDYLSLSADDLESLSADVNEWFLERLSGPVLIQLRDADEKISRLYFLAERGMQQYFVVTALLSVDAQSDSGRSTVSRLWNAIRTDQGRTSIEQDRSISILTEILLDQVYLSDGAGPTLRALRELLRAERSAYKIVLDRANSVDGTYHSRLMNLLHSMEQSPEE